MVYEYPTITRLAYYLQVSVTDSTNGSGKSLEGKRQELHALVEKFTQNIPESTGGPGAEQTSEKVVLLTGGTGSLGCNILARLLESESVCKVYALSRPSHDGTSAKDRHVRAFERESLSVDMLDSAKVQFFDGDASLENFGIPPGDYDRVGFCIFDKWHASHSGDRFVPK